MRAGVSGTLVEANAGDVAIAVRPELHPEFQWRVGPVIGGCRCRSARPNRAWTCLRNCRDCNPRPGNFQIAAVIYGPALDGEGSGVSGYECVTPILSTHCWVPGFSSIR